MLEIISNYAAVVYRTTAKTFGEEASKITPSRPLQHGFNGKFSTVSNSDRLARIKAYWSFSLRSIQLSQACLSITDSTPQRNVIDSWTTARTGKTRNFEEIHFQKRHLVFKLVRNINHRRDSCNLTLYPTTFLLALSQHDLSRP